MSAEAAPDPAPDAQRWDLFCHVVDNYGDIGFCWRLAAELARRGCRVRLFVDDPSALDWMAPGGCPGVRVVPVAGLGEAGTRIGAQGAYEAGDVVVAAFGCALPADALVALRRAAARRVLWIHLEYLSAEPYAAASHGLASPVAGEAAAGVRRWFYFPGFTPATGGLLREADLVARRAAFDRAAWLAGRGLAAFAGETLIGLFCYEPARLADLLAQLAGARARLLVTHGRSARAVDAALAALPDGARAAAQDRIVRFEPLAQAEFDELLWACDLNFVRGEDSLVRALWAGAPFVWQAYPQDDAAHHAKLGALLDWLDAPASLRETTWRWNGAQAGALPPLVARMAADGWRTAVERARAGLLAQDDLATRLLRFAAEKR